VLRWRLILGFTFIAVGAGLFYLDAQAGRPGSYVGAVALAVTWLCAGELLAMFRAKGLEPAPAAFYAGALLPVLFSCVPIIFHKVTYNYTMGAHGWLAVGLIAGLAVAFVSEMRRFDGSRPAMIDVAVTAFAVLYLGGCMGALVQLRLVRAPNNIGGFIGLQPLLILIITVKLSDICQYAVGRTIGRHKLAPKLSPGKTWEGAVGGIALAGTIVSLTVLLQHFGWALLTLRSVVLMLAFTGSVAIAGLLGDLSESLLKRDAGVKDSSAWMPGFGGVLDMMDSLLLAAPMAYLWFVNGFLDFSLAADPLQLIPT
jgi:phosphatidate cytidylyltransferase